MNDVLAGAACDFENDTPRRQDAAKDIKNEIAITYGCKRVLAMIGHLPRIFDLAGALFTTCASFSFATSSDVFAAEVSRDSVEAVYDAAHRHVIVASLSEPRDPGDETTTRAAVRPWLGLAMTRGSDRFIDLFVRSAPWRRAQ